MPILPDPSGPIYVAATGCELVLTAASLAACLDLLDTLEPIGQDVIIGHAGRVAAWRLAGGGTVFRFHPETSD